MLKITRLRLPLFLFAILALALLPAITAQSALPDQPQSATAAPGAWEGVWRGTGALHDLVCPTTDICYAVGDDGLFLKTANHGESWRFSEIASQDLFALAFVDAQHGIAVGETGKTLHTDDGGVTWRTSTTPAAAVLNGVSLLSNGLAWTVGAGGVIFHSNDWGASWTAQNSTTTENLHGVQFLDENNGFAVGDKGKVLQTTNGGATWAAVNTGFPAWVNVNALHFPTAQNGWIAGQAGTMYRTTNGGDTWTPVDSGVAVDILDIHFTGTAGILGGDHGVIATSMDGVEWTQRTSPLFDLRATTAVYASGPTDLWAGGLNKLNPDTEARGWWIRQSADGSSFDYVAGDMGPDRNKNIFGTLYDVANPGEDIIYVVGEGNVIGKSVDGGDSWAWHQILTQGEDRFLALSCPTVDDCWVGGWNNLLYHTSDGGQTWEQQVAANNSPVWDLAMVTTQVGYLGGNPKMFYTNDGGATWKQSVTPGDNAHVDISMINATDGWAALRNYSYRFTTSGGQLWTRVIEPVLSEGNYIAVQALDDNQDGAVDKAWLVGCGGPLVNEECKPFGKVAFTEDGGVTWKYQSLPDGTPPLNDIFMFNALNGWLAGNAGSLLYTSNGGTSWDPVQSGLPDWANVLSLDFLDDASGFGVTWGGVIIRFTGPGKTLGSYEQAGGITIDGQPGDWYQGGALYFDAATADRVLPSEPLPDAADISADFYSRWNFHTLYFLAEITDNVVSPQGDVFYLAIDGRDDNLWNGFDDHMLEIRPDGTFTNTLHPDRPNAINVAVNTTATGWTVELAVNTPELMRADYFPGDAIGFNVAFDDDDGAGVEHQLVMEGKAVDENPATFGTIHVLGNTITYRQGAGGYDGAADTHLEQWDDQTGNTPRGADVEMKVIYNLDKVFSDALFRFELTGLPDQAKILEATLDAVVTNQRVEAPLTLSAYQVLKAWDARTATWKQPMTGQSWGMPGARMPEVDHAAPALDAMTISSVGIGDHLQFDVTAAVAAWRQGSAANNGLLILPSSGRRYVYFGSSENGSESKRPSLIVRYELQPRVGTPTPTPSPTATPTATLTPSPTPTA
ncbi:MAG: DNRLRE domain-containing protein, partial [Caldilineales bacterium]|nr:DNRLRE domain-containing protein [Caldilineales bacterium]